MNEIKIEVQSKIIECKSLKTKFSFFQSFEDAEYHISKKANEFYKKKIKNFKFLKRIKRLWNY